MSERQAPEARVCPVCGTEVTMVRGRNRRRLVWCWKCESYLRAGVAREKYDAMNREAVPDE